MRELWLLGLALIGMGGLLFTGHLSSPFVFPTTVVLAPKQAIRYEVHTLPQSVVHTLLIPAEGGFVVNPALSSQLDTLENFIRKHRAIAALNGGFFDPENHKSTSYLVLQGKPLADPRLNERLMNNPALTPYLDKILNRTEFRRYLCEQAIRYDITLHTEPPPKGCQLADALGGGPRLLPEITLGSEGFWDDANGEVLRDPLSSRQPNARTAVGITPDGSIVWVMVAQKPEAPVGMSLPELAKFMQALGVEKAMNLDGGSSSSFNYQGKTFYGKVDKGGNLVRRPVKSVLLVQETLENR